MTTRSLCINQAKLASHIPACPSQFEDPAADLQQLREKLDVQRVLQDARVREHVAQVRRALAKG